MNEQPVSKILFKGDWGRFPNKQFSQRTQKGGAKISKPVQVCPACQFVVTLV